MQPITIEHKGIAITYDERENKWKFELRGRKRSAESLQAAREAIDKPAPSDEKPFKPIKAWLWKYSDEVQPVTVTSIAEPARYTRGVEVWIKTESGTRSKESVDSIIQDCPEVTRLVAEFEALEDERTKLFEIGQKKKNEAMKFKIKLP